MPDQNERPSLGCLSYLAAHCLATYALSVVGLISERASFSIWMVVVAPLIMPAMWLFGWMLVGNSEIPVDSMQLIIVLGIYIVLYLVALRVIRECLMHPRIAYFVRGMLLLYFLIAAWLLR